MQRNITSIIPANSYAVSTFSVYKYSHSVSDLRELLRIVLWPFKEEERAAGLRLLEVASCFSSWKTMRLQ